jgi:hypothetical protein
MNVFKEAKKISRQHPSWSWQSCIQHASKKRKPAAKSRKKKAAPKKRKGTTKKRTIGEFNTVNGIGKQSTANLKSELRYRQSLELGKLVLRVSEPGLKAKQRKDIRKRIADIKKSAKALK